MKQWYSAFELAGLPDLPALPNNIARKAKAERWQSRQRTGRGGGREYAYNSLPQTAQTALIHNSDRIVDVNSEPLIGSPKVISQVQYSKSNRRTSNGSMLGWQFSEPTNIGVQVAVNGGWIPHQIQNPRELDFLMMAAPGKEGTRHVGRQGISVCGRLYVAAELAGWIGKTVYVCFDPQQPSTIYVYCNDRLTEFVCQAVWREATDIDLADIANRARHLYEILLRSVNQIRKRGKTLLRKLASDPYLLVGKTAQELTEVFQSKLHDYPAIQAITAAIVESESRSEAGASSHDDREPPAMELEQYHQELKRLEAESERQLLLQEQQQSQQYRLEELINCWQQQHIRPVLETSELDLLIQHLSLPEGRGFLAAVTISQQEERQFFDWLLGRVTSQLTVVDRRPLLQDALVRWRDRQSLSLEDKQSLLYYIQTSRLADWFKQVGETAGSTQNCSGSNFAVGEFYTLRSRRYPTVN
jgi:Mu transposase, C-terminal/Mu DNA-binding domain